MRSSSDRKPPDREAACDTSRAIEWLVLRAQSGDRVALERLLREAERLLRPYVTRMLDDGDTSDDVLQDVLVLVYRKLKSIRDPRAFNAWARRIAAREVFRVTRRNRRRMQAEEELSLDANTAEVEGDPLPDFSLSELQTGLQLLSPASRGVLVLHYMEGLTLAEVAAVLDLAPGTVKSRLAYGLQALRRRLDPTYGAAGSAGHP